MASTVTELLRRRFGGKKEDSYITDGLIFHLDGINRGTTDPTKWVDLVGGVEFNGTNSWGANYRIGNSSNTMVAYGITEPTLASATMEIVYRVTEQQNRRIYEPNVQKGNNFCFGYAANYMSLTNNTSNKRCIKIADAPRNHDHCVSYYGTKIVLDGAEYTPTNYDWFYGMNDGSTRIGHLGCRIYSIRFYNRLLTTDEMIHNQRVDNERFQLGLTI